MIGEFCVPLVGCPSSIASGIAGDAAGAVIGDITTALVTAADWLVYQATTFALDSPEPTLSAGGITTQLQLMEQVALLVVLPLLLAATIGPVLRQDGRRLLRVWGIGLPVAVFSGLFASQFAEQGLDVTNYLCSLFISGSRDTIVGNLDTLVSAKVFGIMPAGVQIFLSSILALGALMVWLELVVRASGVYVAVFFMPLALVAFVWPATAGIAKRAVELLVALIISKFVIVASLSLGLTMVTQSGPAAVVEGCGILLIAAFTPFLLFRMTPVVEAAAIAHMEGLSRRPMRAVTSAASMGANQPAVQMMMSAASRSGSGAGHVGAVDSALAQVPDAKPDYVPTVPTGGDD